MLTRIAIITLLAISCNNPTPGNTVKEQTPDTLKKQEIITTTTADTVYTTTMRSYKDSIDHQIRTFKKIHKNLDASSEGGEALLYLSGKDTLKIESTFYGEMGKSVYVLYLKNGHPVFYVGTIIYYKEPIYLSRDVKTARTNEDKIVLRNNVVMSWVQNGKTVNDKYEEKAKEISDLYNDIQRLIKE